MRTDPGFWQADGRDVDTADPAAPAGTAGASMAEGTATPGVRTAADATATAELFDDPLDITPFGDDDLEAELRRRAPKGVPGRTTLALGGTVLVVAGFLGGVLVQKNIGTASGSSSTGGLPAAFATGGAGGFAGRGGQNAGGTGQGGGGAGVTTGTVKLVDGTTLYITTAAGETVTVKTSGSTTVRTDQAASLADIPVGASVSVRGTTDAQGTVTATQVTAQK